MGGSRIVQVEERSSTFLFFEMVFRENEYDPHVVRAAQAAFEAGCQTHVVHLTGQTHVPGQGHAGWLQYALREQGDVWIDGLALVLLDERSLT